MALVLAAGGAMLWKPASDEAPGFAEAVARALNDALGHRLVVVVRWRGGDPHVEDPLLEAVDAVVVQGEDGSVRSLAERTPATTPMLGYAHRFSVAMVHADDDPTADEARGLARDVLAYDGFGCLSPRVAFLVGADLDACQGWARAFAAGPWKDRLRAWPALSRMLPGEVFESRGFAARAAVRGLFLGDLDAPLGVGGLRQIGRAPPGRSLALCPLPRSSLRYRDLWHRLFADDAARLQGLAASARVRPWIEHLSGQLSLVAPPGRLQRPAVDWQHDGMPPLSSLFTPTPGP
jgi:hypothetical protein